MRHVCPNCGSRYEFDELGDLVECCSPSTWKSEEQIMYEREMED